MTRLCNLLFFQVVIKERQLHASVLSLLIDQD